MGNSGPLCGQCKKQKCLKYDKLQLLCCECLVSLGDTTRYFTGLKT
jgi:hypothetical protein